MLKQNTTILAQYPFRLIGGIGAERTMWDQTERRNKFVGEAGLSGGTPNGHSHPSSWNLAQKSGGLSSYTAITGAGASGGDAALGLNASATVTGSGAISDATAQLVISMVANLAGSGTIAASDLRGYLNATATLTGGGSVAAAIKALAWASAALSAGGSVTGATPYASGALAANLRGYSELTPEGISDKVWGAVAGNYTEVNTMGQKLNSAASGGVDYAALGAAVWASATRTLTSATGTAPSAEEVAAAVWAKILP